MTSPAPVRLPILLAVVAGMFAAPALAQAPAASLALPAGASTSILPPAGYPPSLSPAKLQALRALKGYLTSNQVPDTFHVLPPAPSGRSPARQADIAAYRETRRMQGGERWKLATSDAVVTPFSLLDDESCALGARLDQSNAPHLVELLTRLGKDTGPIVNTAKDQFKQERPFVALGGPICTERDRDQLARSYSYPSGHTTYSWAVGLILAELAPDRAVPVLARARAYGESRVVCGVHWVSDVEEGRANGSILVAVLHAQPQFEADLAAARREIDAARAAGRAVPTGSLQCAAQASEHTPWTR